MTVPSELFRNAIDLNRYSTGVARRLIIAYNQIILDAVQQLQGIDEAAAPMKAARLRAILAQLKASLDTWAGDSTMSTAVDLQGIAELQSEFVAEQLRKALPAGARSAVNTVEISPQFAQAVVTTDPTQLNAVVLSDDLFKTVYGVPANVGATFSLTATQGAMITLPNGAVVEKAFRGIAEAQAEQFSQVVRNGLLTGETTPAIAKRLVGKLQFGDTGPLSVQQLRAAGGELTTAANHQVMTLVRTSVNQVANAAAMQTYEANPDITSRYRYVATLDSRTSAICRALDGREFPYGRGPKPPQHFGCRSTIVAVIDDNLLGPSKVAKRASKDGPVPADTTYGKWLYDRPAEQQKVLGNKAPYFRRLAEKHGPETAIAKLVREDGSEVTLAELRKRYGPVQPSQ